MDIDLNLLLGSWTKRVEKKGNEIVETFSGDIHGRIRVKLDSSGRVVSVDGVLNGVTIRRTYTYNADGSIDVVQEVL